MGFYEAAIPTMGCQNFQDWDSVTDDIYVGHCGQLYIWDAIFFPEKV